MKKITVLTIVGIALLACIAGKTIVSSSDNPQSTSTDTKLDNEKLTSQAKKPRYTGIVKKVDDIAEQITVRIDNLSEDGNGSGVIIAHEGDTYYVLTAKHVLCLPESKTECVSNGQNQIVTPDGKTYIIDPQTVKIPADWLDVAVVEFKSARTYQVATLGNYELQRQWLFTSGFPDTENGSEPQRILTGGRVFEQESTDFNTKDAHSLSDGQELLYSNISHRGMSGGAVLDFLGRVVGINTASEGKVVVTGEGTSKTLNLGFSLGVPITYFIGSADKVYIQPKWLEIQKNIASEMDSNEVKNIKQQLLVAQKPSEGNNYIDWINYGNQLWRYENHQEAIEAFKKAISLKDNFHEAYYGIGLAYFDSKKYKKAIVNFQKATDLQPSIAYYWGWLGRSYRYSKNYSKALFSYNNAININAMNIEQNLVFYVRQGEVLKGLKKYLEAIDSYNKALAIRSHPWIYTHRGNTYRSLGQYDKALTDYERAIQLNPENADIYYNRGNTYRSLGKYDKALTDYERAIRLNPKYTDIYNMYYERGNGV